MPGKYKVAKERKKQFAFINEAIFEKTAYAESKAFVEFKDLSLLQVHGIRLIEYHKPCTMTKLANSMGLSLASITQMIDRLIRKEYVERERSTKDRRVVHAKLTPKGRRVIQASKKHVDIVAQDILSKFTEAEQDVFLSFWERMMQDE